MNNYTYLYYRTIKSMSLTKLSNCSGVQGKNIHRPENCPGKAGTTNILLRSAGKCYV